MAGNFASNPATYTACLDCHDGKTVLKNKFGVTSAYAEAGNGQLTGITCAVCHDPHGNGNKAQLRAAANARSPEDNLCYKCHNRNSVPSGGTARNYPHAAQGPLIFGLGVGWQPPGFPSDRIYGTHSSEANEGLCATCHLASYAVTDKVTGAFKLNTTGHLFKSIPCLDASGVPTSSENCTLTQRSYKSCVASGCHGSETAARSALTASEARLTNLSTELKRLVGLAKVKTPADWKNDAVVTPLEGMDFNAQIVEHDLSRGAHNPFYLDVLLNTSITYIKSYYGVQ